MYVSHTVGQNYSTIDRSSVAVPVGDSHEFAVDVSLISVRQYQPGTGPFCAPHTTVFDDRERRLTSASGGGLIALEDAADPAGGGSDGG